MNYQMGRLPNDPSKPRLSLGKHLSAESAPTSVDWYSKVSGWGVLGNDWLPDCVCAGQAHALLSLSTYASDHPIRMTEQETVTLYSALSGWVQGSDPASAPGLVVQDALNYWRTSGIQGHNIVVFAAVDITRLADVRTATAYLGCTFVGINFPNSAMRQFDNGQPWDVVGSDGGIDGGHLVLLTGYNEQDNTYTCVTWGQTQVMTEAFWTKYVEECWAVITPEWVESSGSTPSGLDIYGLGEDFTRATGEPNPFPAPPATPTQAPPPQRTEPAMTAVQDHIDAISTALDEARTGIETEVTALKEQVSAAAAAAVVPSTPDAPAALVLDFSKLEAAVAKLSGDAPVPAPSPEPAPSTPPTPSPVSPVTPDPTTVTPSTPATPTPEQPPVTPAPADPSTSAPTTPPASPPADPSVAPTTPTTL